jgi:phosphoglycolate phosphatase-like HAD superfamily hydrolase
MRPIVALDFDGVVCDSVDECLLVAHGAYKAWRAPQALPVPSFVQPPEAFSAYFRAHRYLVRPAQEYWLLVHAFNEGAKPLTMSRFRELARVHRRELAEFGPIYFRTREALRASDPAAWFRLYRVYGEFAGAWPLLAENADMHIVTTRDQASLRLLLDEFSIDIPASRLWTKERTATKPEAILAIAQEAEVACSAINYVDDHVGHLQDVSDVGAAVFWASWGYWPAALAPNASWCRRLRTLADLPVLRKTAACA